MLERVWASHDIVENISYCCRQRQRRYPHVTSNQAETHSDVQGDGKPAIRNKKECSRCEPKSTRTFLREEEASRKAMSSLTNAQMTKDRDYDMSGSPSLPTGNTPSQTQNTRFSGKARPKERIHSMPPRTQRGYQHILLMTWRMSYRSIPKYKNSSQTSTKVRPAGHKNTILTRLE